MTVGARNLHLSAACIIPNLTGDQAITGRLWIRGYNATMQTDLATSAYRMVAADVLRTIGSDPSTGLDNAEAASRLQRYGPNELPTVPPTPAWRRFLAQFQDPLTILLLVATVVSFIAWRIEHDSPVPYESITILAIVIFNGILGYVQESRAEQAIAALRAMSAATTRVIRNGLVCMVPTATIVPGDVLQLEEGDTIAADARIVEAIALSVAEAALTGESAPVMKDSRHIDHDAGIGDRFNMVFSGTAVAAGRGRAVVVATGAATEIGKIAGSLQQAEDEQTPLQRELARTGRMLGLIIIGIAIVISITILLVGQVRSLIGLVDVLLLAVSLAVAAVPEGLTAVTTIVLSLGMQRMALRNVIVRKLSAVETLGSTTVICTDKTGTLTKNEMTVRTVMTASGRVDLTGSGYEPYGALVHGGRPLTDHRLREEVEKTLRAACLANNAILRHDNGRWVIHGDPTEGALLVAYAKLVLQDGTEPDAHDRTTDDLERRLAAQLGELSARFPRVGEAPFTSERKLMSTAHADADRDERVMVCAKGAPDVLLARCTHERVGDEAHPLSDERRAAILAGIEQMASEALRTIGVAYRTLPRHALELPETSTGTTASPGTSPGSAGQARALSDTFEEAFVFLGVVGMIDPPRPEARGAVDVARRAGIRPIMITGDHPITAAVIAADLGIAAGTARVVRGADVQHASDATLQQWAPQVQVYARVAPEHKLRIVQALKRCGEIVAMTGDGVNDAPALKAADIGVAMGITGTDVARGASDMILTDDNFASIVAAVDEGRAIFSNIQKFLRYLLSSNIGEVMVMFFGVLLAGVIGLIPEAGSTVVVPLLAVQILWINLLTDSAPALALGVDPPHPDQMKRPPRDPRTPVITMEMWRGIFGVGAVMAIVTLLVMDWSLPGGIIARDGAANTEYARTMAFTTLVFLQLFNVFNARSDRRSALRDLRANRWIWLAVVISALLQVAVIYLPPLQQAFGTVALNATDWAVAIGASSVVLWVREVWKLIVRSAQRSR